jgi:Fe-S-cluster containining protein
MNDVALVQIVDAALAEAARKAGSWLACRPGCAECCIGPFEITTPDAQRLREGLGSIDPAVAARIRERADRFGGTDSELCPALDPDSRTCQLYAWRPVICRTFGPPLHFRGEDLAVCELCFDGAAPEEIAACEVEIDIEPLDDSPVTIAQALCSPTVDDIVRNRKHA